ncbi:MAG TPA: hypothetical protein VH764_09925 [Gemmatimonadales bacterium]|jgi:uncharacterized membrane protein YagU involved in acid resistance
MSRRRDSPWPLVLAGGLLAAALDITYACVFWAVKADLPPSRIFQSVAAGLLGDASFEGGTATAALGLLLHFFIACSMALTYYLVARRWLLLARRPVPLGIAYGLLLYVIMRYIVVPLSAAGGGSHDPLWIALSIAVHALLIGLPIAWFASRAISRSSP